MSSQPIMAIFPVSMILLWVGLYALRLSKRTLSRRALLMILISAILLSGVSLLVNNPRAAGTNIETEYGWPHSFLMRDVPMEQPTIVKWSLYPGPIASYVLVNIVFYFSVFILIIGGFMFWRKKPTPEPAL